jgi:tetratricopeptide (TPR) repeat protein
MKKRILVSIALITVYQSFAQLTNAILGFQNGEIKIAKESIDKYMLKEKSLQEAKAWYTKGNIYESIFYSTDESIKSLDPNALKVAVEAYQKAIALDKPGGEFATNSKPRIDNIWGATFNSSIEKYKAADYKKSLELMSICQSIKPADTLAYNVGASIAIEGKDFNYAKSAYRSLISMNYKPRKVYQNLYYVVKEELKNTDEAFLILAEARKEFPNDKEFQNQEIDLYISTGKQQEAINKLNEAIKADAPNAKVYYYNLGIIYKQMNDNAKSKEALKQSLALDSLYEGSNFMMGYLFMDEGDILNKKINNMTGKEYAMTGKNEENKRDAIYKRAIPFLEKSYKVNKDAKLKSQLVSLYTKFKMDAKLKQLD